MHSLCGCSRAIHAWLGCEILELAHAWSGKPITAGFMISAFVDCGALPIGLPK